MMAEHLEDHDDMRAVDSVNFEIVQQLDTLLAEWIGRVALANTC